MAITDFTDAIRLNPNLVEAYILRGRALVASVSIVSDVGENFDNIITNNRAGSISEEQSWIYNLAINNFSQAIRLDPNNSTAYRERGRVYFNIGDFNRAIADFNQAIQINPNFEPAYTNRGNEYSQIGDFDRAIADFSQAIQINPNSYSAYMYRGYEYFNRNDLDKAIADYEAVLQLEPNNVHARQFLEEARRSLGR